MPSDTDAVANDDLASARAMTGEDASSAASHRRTPSGSLFSKLAFLRTASATTSSGTSPVSPGAEHGTRPTSLTGPASPTGPSSPRHERSGHAAETSPSAPSSAASMVMRKKTRSRKGSLRKTALLGTGRLWRDQLETIASPRLQSALEASAGHGHAGIAQGPPSPLLLSPLKSGNELGTSAYGMDDDPTPRPSWDRSGEEYVRASNYTGGGKGSGSTGLGQQRAAQKSTSSEEGLTLRGPHGTVVHSDMSTTTTDEDDLLDTNPTNTSNSSSISAAAAAAVAAAALSGTGPSSMSSASQPGLKHLPEDPISYFSSKAGVLLRRYSAKPVVPTPKSPLAETSTAVGAPEEWDYAETEWWGWIILIVTWTVFVVGMGSCFGVWSWAWDVGETPYAPPELEDDATLPIVGYYPALIILTGVMAWVWVIIAWVGMKYFRHAKMAGDT